MNIKYINCIKKSARKFCIFSILNRHKLIGNRMSYVNLCFFEKKKRCLINSPHSMVRLAANDRITGYYPVIFLLIL